MATSSSTRRMIGRIEETSASFEARSAPRSYPTNSDIRCASQHKCSPGESRKQVNAAALCSASLCAAHGYAASREHAMADFEVRWLA